MSSEIILRRAELQLARVHRAAHGTVAARPTLIVEFRVEDADGAVSGWGECPALPEPGYSPEYTDGAQAMLAERIIPAVASGGVLDPGSVTATLSAVPDADQHPMARSALALAADDLAARQSGDTLASRWGATVDLVPAGAALSAGGPLPDDDGGRKARLAALAAEAIELANAGYRRLKVKVSPGDDVDPARAVIEALRSGPHRAVEVAVDANASYRLDDPAHADALRRLDRLGLTWIEQPLAAEDLDGHARLAELLTTRLCLDESITSVGAAEAAVHAAIDPIVCVKWARLGGPTEARRLLAWCHANGVDAYVGGMLSSGIGRACDRALAALPGANRTGDLGADSQYFHEDIASAVFLSAGAVPVMSEPNERGLGILVDRERLTRLTTSIQHWAVGT